MREIPIRNYIIACILLVLTVVITLFLSNLYTNRLKPVSDFYNYSNKITAKEFDVFITENPDSIVYLDSKYDLDNDSFEAKLKNKIEHLNIKEKFVYINVNNKLINNINKKYKVKIDINKIPVAITFVDGNIYRYEYIANGSEPENVIDFGVFE